MTNARPLRLILMSDTHGREGAHPVPDGDILLHAGDLTDVGRAREIAAVNAGLGALPHRHKLVIAGNHDFLFENDPPAARALMTGVTYLEDTAADAAGLKVWGSPWQPWFFDWAFNLKRGAALAEKWARVPDDVDVLVTHGPPYGIGDRCHDGRRVGCRALLDRVRALKPRLHVFGHIHEDRGWWQIGETLFVNAAQNYDTHPAMVVEWSDTGPRIVEGEAGGPIDPS